MESRLLLQTELKSVQVTSRYYLVIQNIKTLYDCWVNSLQDEALQGVQQENTDIAKFKNCLYIPDFYADYP